MGKLIRNRIEYTGSSGADELDKLSDVNITSATDGQVLKYNNGTWENANESTGSSVSVTQVQSTGTKIATITVDSVGTDLYAPTGGSGGHTILDDNDTALTQRTDLQFAGTYSEDDGTDDKTIVNITRSMTRAEFDLLSADEKIGLIHITDETSSGDGKFQPIIYSEEEREIGVWIDGKPLYEKTIINSNPSYTQAGSIYECNTSVDFSGVDYFMIVNATALNANSTRPINDTRTDIMVMGYVSVGKSTNVIYTAFNTDSYTKLVFTLRYTKTTDTPGSGQWTPQGVPAVHYSTDEQVIGTWIDGSTVYERTYVFESDVYMTSNNWVDTPISNTNFSKIISFEAMNNSGTNLGFIGVNRDAGSGYVQLLNTRNTSTPCRILTLRYTKSSS